jgi:hypothetical protein
MADQVYKTIDFRFLDAGLIASTAKDAAPEATYLNLDNWDWIMENAITTRMGARPINSGGALPGVQHSIGRLRGLSSQWRYVGTGTDLYRGNSPSTATLSKINGSFVLNGTAWTELTYRPDFSAYPWAFFADRAVMLKDNGSLGTAVKWGYFPPTRLPSAVVSSATAEVLDKLDVDSGISYLACGAHSAVSQVNTTIASAIGSTGQQTVTPAAMTNIIVGSLLVIDTGNPNEETVYVSAVDATTFSANFTKTHGGGVAVNNSAIESSWSSANLNFIVYFPPTASNWTIGGSAYATDQISILLKMGDPTLVASATLAVSSPTGTGFIQLISGTPGTPVFPDAMADTWYQWKINRSDIAANSGVIDWTNIIQVNVSLFIDGSATTLNFGINDLCLLYGGPDVTGGTPYDYRITGLNNNTGGESNGSQTWVDSNRVSPVNQAVLLNWTDPPDPQYTHVRIYRRGGSLTDGWYRVGQVAIGVQTFTDTVPDLVASVASRLALDNDPPVTSALQAQINATLSGSVTAGSFQTVTTSSASFTPYQYATVGIGAAQEVVIIESVVGNQISAWFQYAHDSGTAITATAKTGQALNIGCVSNDRVWLAGDVNNPNVIYYSKPKNAEAFPPQNTLEVGSPDSPIMALIPSAGLIWAITATTIWGISVSGSIPAPFPTGIKHGLVACFAYCVGDSGEIYYLAQDGIYEFRGGASVCITDMIEWAFQPRPGSFHNTLGVGVTLDVVFPAVYPAPCMAYYQGQVFFADGSGQRFIFDTRRKRWRNETFNVRAMLAEPDTTRLVIAKSDGYIYYDRIADVDTDALGAVVPFQSFLQTAFNDFQAQDNEKNLQNVVLDLDTQGTDLVVEIYYNNQSTSPVSLGLVNQNGRGKVRLPVNSGKGQLGFNFSIKISNFQVTKSVILWQMGAEALIEPIYRKAFDTYWTNFGLGEGWKFVHQAWNEYYAPADITVSCYLDGDIDNAVYSYVLPAVTVRTERRDQLPAFKGKQWRYIYTSEQPFKLYSSSHIEVKPTDTTTGYQMVDLAVS